jgi:hypothetical protein
MEFIMQKKSFLSILATPFTHAATPAMPMRELSVAEAAAVAGGPEMEHEPQIVIEPPASM